MKSILLEIQETVIKYADIISKIANIDVEVVDEHLFRVAGTGIFSDEINCDMSHEGYVYQKVIETGEKQIIYEPGKEPVCQACVLKDHCKEEIEISMPILNENKVIGVIGLVGSTRQQKELILENEDVYMGLLEQIADFIAVKATEVTEMKHKNELLDTMKCMINHVNSGIMVLSSDNFITAANKAAIKQFGIDNLENQFVKIISTGDSLIDQNEYKIELNHLDYYVMGQINDLNSAKSDYAKMLIFENSRNIQKKYYEMTATLQSVDSSNFIGSSVKTKQLKEEISKIASSRSTVLITGESGTGKEMVAAAIWNASDRREARFVAINCAAIPEALLESELFGYVKGAFTGADPNGRIGKFELANKGIIFLDEIGDMPLYLQAKLLRVLQERTICRIGSNQVIPLDIRVIAATNKDLKGMILEKKFREDLFYRLNVIPLKIAPLRERQEDIVDLANFFALRYGKLSGKQVWEITESTIQYLLNYSWPGNVRELENVLEFMVNMMGDNGVLDDLTLPKEIKQYVKESHQTLNQYDLHFEVQTLKQLEYLEIMKALKKYGESTEGKRLAAKHLGISLATLYRKVDSTLNSNNENFNSHY